MIWLGPERGYLSDWITQKWVATTGRLVKRWDYPWLAGPIGKTTGIGPRFFDEFAQEHFLNVSRPASVGLISDFSELAGPGFDPARISRQVRDFYERTGEYEIEAWSEWSGFCHPLGRLLALIFSRRLQQLNVPLSGLDTSRGVTSSIIQLASPKTGQVTHTAWLRTSVATGDVIYAGTYSLARIPGCETPCVKVVFPLPKGNAIVIMRPSSSDDGAFTITSSGSRFGDPGFYFTVQATQGKLHVRYVRSMRETIRVYEAGPRETRADHILTFGGMKFLELHYRLRRES